MNGIFELWSLPWHDLQRSLAEAFGAAADADSAVKQKASNSRRTAASAGNWLVRARSGATQMHQAGR